MFDIVAPDEDQLALPVEVVGVDDAEPRLAGPAVRCRTQPSTEQKPVEQEDHEDEDDDRGNDRGIGQRLVVLEKSGQRLHATVRLSTQAPLKC